MKLLISFMTAVSLGLTCMVLGDDNYSALAAQGYRVGHRQRALCLQH
jgi:hypothetical protein